MIVKAQRLSNLKTYREIEPEEIPAYKISEVAYYLGIARSTLRSWLYGQNYRTDDGELHRFKPLIKTQDNDVALLSFMNLVEAHVLTALRRQHYVPMPVIRRALEYILLQSPESRHPLAEHQFATIGKSLFIERVNSLTDITRAPQAAMMEFLEKYLQRIERTPSGSATILYPFPRLYRGNWTPPKTVAINPRIAFGRPVLAGTNIPTAVIAERIITGETPDEVAEDYNKTPAQILDAIRWELYPAAA